MVRTQRIPLDMFVMLRLMFNIPGIASAALRFDCSSFNTRDRKASHLAANRYMDEWSSFKFKPVPLFVGAPVVDASSSSGLRMFSCGQLRVSFYLPSDAQVMRAEVSL
jgi:hypothetical protein